MNEIPIAVNFDTGERFGVSFDDGFNMPFSADDGLTANADFNNGQTFGAALDNTFAVNLSAMHATGEYSGAYEVTPSNQTQTLATAGKIMARDITINPIPSNYGLVAYDGSILSIT